MNLYAQKMVDMMRRVGEPQVTTTEMTQPQEGLDLSSLMMLLAMQSMFKTPDEGIPSGIQAAMDAKAPMLPVGNQPPNNIAADDPMFHTQRQGQSPMLSKNLNMDVLQNILGQAPNAFGDQQYDPRSGILAALKKIMSGSGLG